ncbi:hypothetical protein [Chromatium okenii]|uniref:hypothetical protein n=1 Tax=Chromatium okenii TaxID=61644 RepID=UPI00155914C5|nr:hypothetical protein [Chromatium okenii]
MTFLRRPEVPGRCPAMGVVAMSVGCMFKPLRYERSAYTSEAVLAATLQQAAASQSF